MTEPLPPSRAMFPMPLAAPTPLPTPEPPRGFGRLPIRRWFLIGGAVLAVLVLLATAVTVLTFQLTREARDNLVEVIDPAALATLEVATALTRQESAVRDFGLTGDEHYRRVYQDARQAEDEAMRDIRRLLPRMPDGGGVRRDVEHLRAGADRWRREYAEPVLAGTLHPGHASGEELFAFINSALQEQQADLKELHRTGQERLHRGWRAFQLVLIGLGVLLVATLIGFALVVRYAVLRPVSQLAEQVKTVAEGDFERELKVDRPAELADLSARVDSMRQRMLGEWRRSAQAEQLLSAQTLELRRSNAELEQFAYVASHDLQEPLRKIASFTQLLDQRYGEHLDDRARQYIAFAVDGAKRMQRLINDLLDFSRVGRVGAEVGEVDCAEVLAAVLDDLGAQIEEAGATVTHDPLPTVRGSRVLLTQLFQNLVGNAVKFRSTDPPRIHIGAVRSGPMWRFSCRDNGIGIDAKYADRIFLIFQRLHARDVYPGTGIGLALCKKIVEYHGGEIWVDPNPSGERGTTFHWTLPAMPPGGKIVKTGSSEGGDPPEERPGDADERSAPD